MNKQNFELYLREKLAILKENEVDEIINEYLQHIEMKKADGISEEKAISDFGDLDDLAIDILDAYKIDTKSDKFEDFSATIKFWLNKSLNYINNLTSSIMNRTGREIITLIVEFVVILIVIGLLTSVIDLFARNVSLVFYFRPYFITNIIRFFIKILKTILSLTVSLSVLYWFANVRILEAEQDFSLQKSFKEDQIKQNTKDIKNIDYIQPDQKPLKFKNKKDNKSTGKSFSKQLVAINILILKIIGFLILIPMIVGGVLLGIFFITFFYNTMLGFGSWGILLIVSGVSLIYFYLLIFGINLIGGSSK